MRQLIVYAGANGAGKSSLRADGANPVDLKIDPDRIARQRDLIDHNVGRSTRALAVPDRDGACLRRYHYRRIGTVGALTRNLVLRP